MTEHIREEYALRRGECQVCGREMRALLAAVDPHQARFREPGRRVTALGPGCLPEGHADALSSQSFGGSDG